MNYKYTLLIFEHKKIPLNLSGIYVF